MTFSKKNNARRQFVPVRISPVLFFRMALFCVFFLLSACAFNPPAESPLLNRPETSIIDVRSSVLMKALVRVLSEKKFVINTERSSGQNLETEWLQDGSYRSMVQAEVLPIDRYRSQLKVNLLLQKKTFLRESWQPMDKIDRTVFSKFINDVVIESYRVLYDGR